jgi:hypothetical protein
MPAPNTIPPSWDLDPWPQQAEQSRVQMAALSTPPSWALAPWPLLSPSPTEVPANTPAPTPTPLLGRLPPPTPAQTLSWQRRCQRRRPQTLLPSPEFHSARGKSPIIIVDES